MTTGTNMMIPRSLSGSARVLRFSLAVSLLLTACGASAVNGPATTARVSGVVKTGSGAVVAGASVKVGDAASTTNTSGQFELQDLPAGSARIVTTAAGYAVRSETINLDPGANTHDVVVSAIASLANIYTHGEVVAYLPEGVQQYRAAIVFLPGLRDPATGNSLDSRALVRGTSELQCSIWCNSAERAEVRKRAAGLAGGDVALIGTTTLLDNSGAYETLLQALSSFATQSAQPELANIPIFFVGHSQGGCTAYGFSRVHGARVAGFLTMKGGCHSPAPASAAATVPGYFLIGDLDAPHRRENITGVFEAGRAGGAPWALATDALHHNPIMDFDLMFAWADAVLDARLPQTAGAPLRVMTETAGWLGNRSNGAIATHACYGSSRLSASWLPSEETAIAWQRMAGGTSVVRTC